jgi:phage shock protein A
MGFFARLSNLISANLNAMLDAAEDPATMLAQVIREMESSLATARRHGAKAIAAERRLERELEQNRADAASWQTQAALAIRNGREDLARLALARKIEHDDLVNALAPQLAAAQRTSAQVKTALRAIDARLAEARRKERILLAEHHAVQVRRDVECWASRGPAASLTQFARLENRLADLNAELQAEIAIAQPNGDLEADLAALEMQRRIDDELEALAGGEPRT